MICVQKHLNIARCDEHYILQHQTQLLVLSHRNLWAFTPPQEENLWATLRWHTLLQLKKRFTWRVPRIPQNPSKETTKSQQNSTKLRKCREQRNPTILNPSHFFALLKISPRILAENIGIPIPEGLHPHLNTRPNTKVHKSEDAMIQPAAPPESPPGLEEQSPPKGQVVWVCGLGLP